MRRRIAESRPEALESPAILQHVEPGMTAETVGDDGYNGLRSVEETLSYCQKLCMG